MPSAMYMPHLRLIFFSYCISIILRCSVVLCDPVRPTSDYEDPTSKFNQQVDNLTLLQNSSSRPEVGSMFLQLDPETVTGLSIAGLLDSEDFVMEGDILIETDRSVQSFWPIVNDKVVLPYVIAPVLASRTNDIRAAMNMISRKSCVTFQQRQKQKNYLSFEAFYGCASYVGVIGGAQAIYISPNCSVGNICHELMHALGFGHEHSRMDRDEHIEIFFQNIMKDKEVNFRKSRGDTLGIPYDLNSILHYGRLFFSSNGKPTIVPLNSDVQIGQRRGLSELDVQRIRKLYRCK